MENNKMITVQSMRKLLNRAEMTLVVPEELKNVCRFVTVRYVQVGTNDTGKSMIEIIDAKGLQIENNVYLLNGGLSFVRPNSDLIVSVLDGIPDWADDRLLSIYHAFYDRLKRQQEEAEAKNDGEDISSEEPIEKSVE